MFIFFSKNQFTKIFIHGYNNPVFHISELNNFEILHFWIYRTDSNNIKFLRFKPLFNTAPNSDIYNKFECRIWVHAGISSFETLDAANNRQALISSSSNNGYSSSISWCEIPRDNIFKICSTEIRIPLITGLPVNIEGLVVIRFNNVVSIKIF